MKEVKIHIILILMLIGSGASLQAQCDFFGTVAVQTTGYTSLSGYTQQYILVEDNSGTPGNILSITADGNFGSQDVGTYFLYAVNYEGAQPAELAIGESWSNLDAYDQASENCFEMSKAYLNRAVNVCDPDDICFGNPIEVAVENYNQNAGYNLRYILVSTADGTILDYNSTGSFGEVDYSASGVYEVYALSTNDADLISDLTDGMLFSDFNTLAEATCASLLGPREVTVLDNNFVYVADGTSAEATAFCEVDGWTHYSTEANPHDFVFSIYKNTNDFDATVEIDVTNSSANYLSSDFDSDYSSFTLRRSWSVNASGPDYNDVAGSLTVPVKVRFYYPQSEKTILNNVVNDYINGTNSTGENPLAYMHDYIRDARWFKTIDGNSLDLPAMTTASQITGAYSLTVVGDNLTTANGVNYVELDDITGFSGGTWGIGTGPKDNVDVLPVELVDLQAYAENDVDVIRWTTASEKNNDYFIVESSSDMTRFREIGKRNGAGNSNTKMMYEFINTDIRNQPQYYRLKQVDFDGSYEYSDIVMTNRTAEHKHFSLYPNPFSDYVYVAMEGMNEMVLVEIYDGLGQIVFMRQIETKDHMGAYKFDLSHLSPGVYMIHLTSESFNKSVKLIRK